MPRRRRTTPAATAPRPRGDPVIAPADARPDDARLPGSAVAEVANLYLGNILYALESTAMGLDAQEKRDDAAFYRGIARKLAEARGADTRPADTRPAGAR